jgi:ABC-type multidrug transport system ATPase subunit
MLGKAIPLPWDELLALERRGVTASPRTVTIGRLPVNDVVIDDRLVSGRHARVVCEADGVFLEDLGSRNGTFLVGDPQRVVRVRLERDTLIRLGNTTIPAVSFFLSGAGGTAAEPGELDQTALGGSALIVHGGIDLGGRKGVFVIGRSPTCDVQLDYPMVSARHARLLVEGGRVTIADLGSSNGTFVNGRRVTRPTAIRPGDQVALGSVWLTLSADGQTLIPPDRRGNVTLEARGIGVTVSGRKGLLTDVDLAILPGELVGLMGPSGAGKSTLISALSGYLPPSAGSVTINGRDVYDNYDEFRGLIGYVPQDDIMHADLTVGEALYYTAKLRLPTDYSDDEIRGRIDKTLSDLGLQGSEGTRIGNAERRGISGGQRKRVNVAMELLTDPPLLFLDEPTSGLSSEDALSLMRLLRQLADGGKTVILTIHQPSLDVYRLMDNLIVIGKDRQSSDPGRVAYFGPAHPDAIAFFEPARSDRPVEGPSSPEAVLRGLGTRPTREWVQRYGASDYHHLFVRQRLGRRSRAGRSRLRSRRPVGGVSQFVTLLRRGLAVKLKDGWNTGILLLQAPLIALLIGLVFGPRLAGDVSVGDFPAVATATATTMFLLGVSAIWFGCSNSAREIVAEAAIYRRERMVGLGIPSYLASKLLILAGLCGFQCAVLLAVVGWLGRLQASWSWLFLALFAASSVGVATGLMISAAARTAEVAAAVLPLVILPMVILGGVLLPLPDLPRSPVPTNLAAQLMPSRWAFEALMLPESEGREAIDESVPPPQLVEAGEEGRGDRDGPRDMADAFFPAKNGRIGRVFPLLVMAFQATTLVILAGWLLRSRDIV